MTSKFKAWLTAAVLLACGGMGGAGPNPGQYSRDASFDPEKLQTILYQGEDEPLIVRATVSGTLSTPPAARVEDSTGVIATVDVTPTKLGNQSSKLELALHASPQAPLGVHDGSLRLTLCHDAACQDPYTDASWELPVQLEVQTATHLTPISPRAGVPEWNNYQGSAAHSGYVAVTLDPASFNRRWKVTWEHWGVGETDPLQTVPGQDPYTRQKTFQTHIWFKDQSSLGPGVYKDEITLSVCEDQACQHPVSGSPWVVPVTYTVEGASLSVSPTELKLTHLTGNPPPTATLFLSGEGASWTVSSDFPWIQLGASKGRAPSTLTVGFDMSTLGPGAHTGTILLIDEDHQWFSTLPVTLTVI